jgi:hypothetical protein
VRSIKGAIITIQKTVKTNWEQTSEGSHHSYHPYLFWRYDSKMAQAVLLRSALHLSAPVQT